MPMIYKVRDPRADVTVFYASHPQARKHVLKSPDAEIHPLEYIYKWQIVQMMNEAYRQGLEDSIRCL